MPIGVHTSIAGGVHHSVERALGLGCDAMQIFGRNPRSWAFTPVPETEVTLFRGKRAAAGLWPVAVHTTYLINLCSPDTVIFDKSVDLFNKELATAERLGADYLVTHLGSPQEMGDDYAATRILDALRQAFESGLGRSTQVLLENTAGAGFGFGSRLEWIGRIIEGVKAFGFKAGLCFDTCHGFCAGYPMRSPEEAKGLVKTIDRAVGLESLKLIHLNDSKGAQGSHLDRHEHIGRGKIGIEGLSAFINHPRISSVPLILETPKKTPQDDPSNLDTVRKIRKRA